MREWPKVSAGELQASGKLLVEDGNHGEYRPRPHEFTDQGAAYIRAADLRGGVIDFNGAAKITDSALGRIRKGIGEPRDVILTHKGTVGTVAIAPFDCPSYVCSPQTTFWRSLDPHQLSQDFLFYVVRSRNFQEQLDRAAHQTDMAPYASLTDQKSLQIPLPPLPEQQAIAEVLGALDDKIAANRALDSTIEELSESLYRRAVGNAEETAPFGNFLKFSYGKALKSEDRVPGDVKVLGSGGVTGWHDRALVDHSGIVVGRKGSMGSVHWVDGPHFPIDTAYSVENLTPLPDAFWLFALAKAGFPSMNSDSAVPGLNRDRALAVHTPVPLDTGEFNAVVPPLFETRAATQRESDSLSSLRDTLLPALMDGTIRVKDAEKAVSDVM
ncbi:restriction endonuclease subunit S [Luteococcus sanguinis]|uniref:Restriction endonuclease subunit S n=1 Tax=Luteococcus sanguinis TaxID=174038 RepID=A0ABW1WXP9_9ACTN